jgi:hypothetical protein
MSCDNLCTAAKCAELEARINALEADLAAHKAQDIPQAHKYQSNLKIDGSFESQNLTITVADGISQDTATISIPNDDVEVDLNVVDNQLYLDVTVGEQHGQDTVALPSHSVEVDLNVVDNQLYLDVTVGEQHGQDTVALPSHSVGVDLNVVDNQLYLDVTVGEQHGQDSVTIPMLIKNVLVDVFDLDNGQFAVKVGVNDVFGEDTFSVQTEEHVKSNLKLNGSFQGEILTLTVADGESQDTASISIPLPNLVENIVNNNNYYSTEEKHVKSNLRLDGSFESDTLTLTVADGESYDTVQISMPQNLSIEGYFQEEKLYLTIVNGLSTANAIIEIKMDDQLLKTILSYTRTIYKILGGGVWTETTNGIDTSVFLNINPETKIKQLGEELYTSNSTELNQITATNILDLINIYSTVNYHRNGFHRLPATTLKSLVNTEDGNQEITIYDTFSWQEYLIKQVDALIGEFPIKIKHQGVDSNGDPQEQDIELNNISVAIAEILALNLGIAHDADTNVNIGMKTLIEARNAANAAIVAVDYAQANAQYLGYKGNQTEKEVNCTFTPNARNLRDTLTPSNQKIIGWENEDQETLIELIKKTLIGTEIIKAALFHPYQPGGDVTGDGIKKATDDNKTKNDTDWEQFKQRINNPSGRYQVPKPQANLRDLTIDQPDP